jgi:hypothetical protein
MENLLYDDGEACKKSIYSIFEMNRERSGSSS